MNLTQAIHKNIAILAQKHKTPAKNKRPQRSILHNITKGEKRIITRYYNTPNKNKEEEFGSPVYNLTLWFLNLQGGNSSEKGQRQQKELLNSF